VGGPDTALMYSVGNALASIPVSAPFAFMMCGAALTEIHLYVTPILAKQY
jgi:hypothetical protein